MARNDDGFDDDYDDEDRDVGYADAYEEYDQDDRGEGYEGSAGRQSAVTDRTGDEYAAHGEDDASWTGIALALVAIGAVLFVFPEPLTSSLGVLLVVAGVGLLVVDWLS